MVVAVVVEEEEAVVEEGPSASTPPPSPTRSSVSTSLSASTSWDSTVRMLAAFASSSST